jgi:hypothetical protein
LLAGLAGLAGCNRFSDTIEIGGKRPANPDGHWNVAWTVAKRPLDEPVTCAAAGAKYVLAAIRPGDQPAPQLTYRLECERPGSEAWIPIKTGKFRVSAQLVDERRRLIASIPEYPLEVATATDRPRTPLLFRLK